MALEKQKALYIEAFEGHEKLHHPFEKDTIKMVEPPISSAIRFFKRITTSFCQIKNLINSLSCSLLKEFFEPIIISWKNT